MKSVRWMISYCLAAFLGIYLAFTLSMKFLSPVFSQDPVANQSSGGNDSTSAQIPAALQAPPAPQQEPLPILSKSLLTGEDYFYDPTGKRDPFKPVGLKALGLAKPVVLEPLQRFDLDKLQVVGILWDVRSPRAMVKDPSGIMHTVIKNSKIGRAEGFVATIREGEVVVVETFYDEGKALKKTRVLELKK